MLKRCLGVAVCAVLCAAVSGPAHAEPKYYFRVHDVQAAASVDEEVKDAARRALEEDLAHRPEFTADLGDAKGDAAVAAALAKRKLSGYDVSVKIDKVDQQVKEAKAGSKFPRLEVMVKVSVLATKIPADKLSFSGEGESGAMTEVRASEVEKEGLSLAKDAAKDAVKQAVEQAVAKLSAPVSAPMNESHKKRGRKKKH